MRKAMTIVAMMLAAAAPAAPSAAQEPDGGSQGGYEQQAALPPSAAVKLAMQAVPGAKPLGVKLSNGIYVVRLTRDGTITLVGVDPATGDVFPLQ